ncbi:MAG: hypothetical protein E7184_03475 [Erysipelotrichaceae bacterium]|nr:hypothetical protein [Erysipelotrichaceae bacterium]
MKSLFVLATMQLKDKLNLSFLKNKKQLLFKSIFAIVKFVITIALCFLILSLCANMSLFSLFPIVPTSVIAIVFAIMLLLSTIFTTIDLTKKLYYSYDNRILLTLPASPAIVFGSKLLVLYFYEILKNLTFMIPMFIAYGLVSGFGILYYPWMLFCFVFISMIPVLIGSLLSLPMMWLFMVFRKHKILKIATFVLIVAGISFGIFEAVIHIPSNIDIIRQWGTLFWDIQDFLGAFTNKFSYIYQTVVMMVGRTRNLIHVQFDSNTFFYFGRLILALIIMLVATLLINKPLFYKMASKPFEYKKDEFLVRNKNEIRIPVESIIKKDERLTLRSASTMFNSLFIVIGLPFAILLLNKLFAAMNTRLLGDNLSMFFIILIALLISLSSNSLVASIYSREGKVAYLIKAMPTKHSPFLFSKLFFNILIGSIAFFALGVVLYYTSSIDSSNAMSLTFTLYFVYLAHMLWSAEFDIMNPQNEKYLSDNDYINNPNENKSTFLAFLMAFVFSAFALFLFIEDVAASWNKLLWISIILLIYKAYTYLTKVKYFYRERCE